MSVTDLLFLFVFLPVSLAAYYLIRENFREYILLALSLVFYACGSFQYFSLLLLSSIVTIYIGWLILKFHEDKKIKVMLMALGTAYSLSVLVYYKYADFVLNTIKQLTGAEYSFAQNAVLPLGLSFFTFKAVSYLADAASGKISVINPVRAALYLSFFGQIQSGPLSRYEDMTMMRGIALSEKKSRWNDFAEGACRFMAGFQKKVLLADTLANITLETFTAEPAGMSTAYAWLGAVCYSLQLFFDFSGYSDMAVGISRMFGYRCPENFDYPYMTNSISMFWRRWHITLGAWFRDYVYIPLGGSRTETRTRLYLNLLAVWLLTGIWHGANWNFIFWGLAYFVLIAFEKTAGWPEKIPSRIGKIIYRIFTLFTINFLWVIFRAKSLQHDMQYIKNMFGSASCALADERALFLLKEYAVFIVAAAVLCFPVLPWINKKMETHGALCLIWNTVCALVNMILFLLAVSMAAAGQNNPFAYANF